MFLKPFSRFYNQVGNLDALQKIFYPLDHRSFSSSLSLHVFCAWTLLISAMNLARGTILKGFFFFKKFESSQIHHNELQPDSFFFGYLQNVLANQDPDKSFVTEYRSFENWLNLKSLIQTLSRPKSYMRSTVKSSGWDSLDESVQFGLLFYLIFFFYLTPVEQPCWSNDWPPIYQTFPIFERAGPGKWHHNGLTSRTVDSKTQPLSCAAIGGSLKVGYGIWLVHCDWRK